MSATSFFTTSNVRIESPRGSPANSPRHSRRSSRASMFSAYTQPVSMASSPTHSRPSQRVGKQVNFSVEVAAMTKEIKTFAMKIANRPRSADDVKIPSFPEILNKDAKYALMEMYKNWKNRLKDERSLADNYKKARSKNQQLELRLEILRSQLAIATGEVEDAIREKNKIRYDSSFLQTKVVSLTNEVDRLKTLLKDESVDSDEKSTTNDKVEDICTNQLNSDASKNSSSLQSMSKDESTENNDEPVKNTPSLLEASGSQRSTSSMKASVGSSNE